MRNRKLIELKKMNNRGFTVVELVVSFALTMIVVIFLFQVVVQIKELYISSGIRTGLLSKQAIITKTISDDISNKKILYATNCGEYCINFTFEGDETKQFKVDVNNKTIRYGSYATKLVTGSKFGDFRVSTETPVMTGSGAALNNNSFIQINIPIKHHLFDEDFGIHLVYQYNNNETALNDIVFGGTTHKEYLYLRGLENMVQFSSDAYVEPGYFVIDANGQMIENDPRVNVSCNVGNAANTTYTCTYSFYDRGTLINTRTRKVTVLSSETYTYAYTGNSAVFQPVIGGVYRVELWGASGGDFIGTRNNPKTCYGGKGAYTMGNISLNINDTLYVYVGGQGGSSDLAMQGGYNGGGSVTNGENLYGRSAGGATDVRLISGQWNNISSLRSRIMVAGGGGGANNRNDVENNYMYGFGTGGAGGALEGIKGTIDGGNVTTGSIPSYNAYALGSGGTQTKPGTLCDYKNQNGSYIEIPSTVYTGGFGQGGGIELDYRVQSAGGGGYYGGGTGIHGGGGGGSSFISGYTGCNAVSASGTHLNTPIHYSGKVFTNGKMIAGNQTMPNYNGSSTIGNKGNGYARISLVSIVNSN